MTDKPFPFDDAQLEALAKLYMKHKRLPDWYAEDMGNVLPPEGTQEYALHEQSHRDDERFNNADAKRHFDRVAQAIAEDLRVILGQAWAANPKDVMNVHYPYMKPGDSKLCALLKKLKAEPDAASRAAEKNGFGLSYESIIGDHFSNFPYARAVTDGQIIGHYGPVTYPGQKSVEYPIPVIRDDAFDQMSSRFAHCNDGIITIPFDQLPVAAHPELHKKLSHALKKAKIESSECAVVFKVYPDRDNKKDLPAYKSRLAEYAGEVQSLLKQNDTAGLAALMGAPDYYGKINYHTVMLSDKVDRKKRHTFKEYAMGYVGFGLMKPPGKRNPILFLNDGDHDPMKEICHGLSGHGYFHAAVADRQFRSPFKDATKDQGPLDERVGEQEPTFKPGDLIKINMNPDNYYRRGRVFLEELRNALQEDEGQLVKIGRNGECQEVSADNVITAANANKFSQSGVTFPGITKN